MPPHIHDTATLLTEPLFKIRHENLSRDQRVLLSHKRTAAVAKRLGLTRRDISEMTPAFWAAHANHIWFKDTGAMTNFTIQYNVVLGTILDQGRGREDLDELVDDLLRYRVS